MENETKVRKKILIIEDDPFIAMDLEDAFKYAGFDVLGPAAQVKDGLQILQSTRPDIAALDYNLGHETSLEIAESLKKLNIPYIFVTGQIERVIRDSELSSVPLFSKPYDSTQIIDKVSSMLEQA